ncbi:hypothetical protein [Anaerococcus hydrogenalis]|uniref:hypothetical protein n=1 Tax=Anaerococcus hydrogenalis TaxID=33029 RepID=UPI001DE735C8|nr:hypothetical protein [Anaerococcus hydrogenalis]MBS5989448.1 hypothetical protein [Anaerococcus hydrogenalis]
MTKKELTIDDVNKALNKALKEFAKNENNLDEKNPYKEIKLKEVFDEFFESLEKNDSNFSWVDKLNRIDKNKNAEDKDKVANIHYGLPSHVHGNYKDGSIYLCLFNPNVIGIIDNNLIYKSESSKKESAKICSLEDYYTKPPLLEEKKDPIYDEFWRIINSYKEWKNDDKKRKINIEKLKNLIISDESTLTKELKNPELGTYYIDNYFDKLINKCANKLEDTDKIVNMELCPFRSKNASTISNDILKSEVGLFACYIIWYRIGKYKNNKNSNKPIFIFRSYSNWEKRLIYSLYELNNKKITQEAIGEYMTTIRNEFFYHFPNQSGMISSKNLRKFVSEEEFDHLKKNIKKSENK